MPRGRVRATPQPPAVLGALVRSGIEPHFAEMAVRIGQMRVSRGWTRQQLCEATGLNNRALAEMEQGTRDPSLSTLVKLCQVLGLRSFDELLGMPGQSSVSVSHDGGPDG